MKDIAFKTVMLKGETGSTITRIEKTSTVDNVDTYTIYLSDGNTQTFTVTNGTSIESVEKTATSGYQDTYTITLTDGSTFDFQVMNGQDGAGYEVPADTVIYMNNNDPAPEGYQSFGDLLTVVESSAFNTASKTPVGAVNELNARIPYGIMMSNYSASFVSGASSLSLADLGLTGKTIRVILASPNYSSGAIGANCFVTCQVTSSGVNLYIRDGVSDTVPVDGTYSIALFIAYS